MKKIAAVIFVNNENEILLYLRDNKPTIPFPHCWDLFGGHIEDGETPEEALVREVKEELNYDLIEYEFFREYECTEGDAYPNIKYIYVAKIDKTINELELCEGEKMQFFTREELKNLKFANILKEVVLDYVNFIGD